MEPDKVEGPYKEFSDDEISCAVYLKPFCRVEFEAKVMPHLVEVCYQTGVKQVGKNAKIAGFRKGKAPDNLVITHYPSQIEDQWKQLLANLVFEKCYQKASIPILNSQNKPTYTIESCSREKGALLRILFETEPNIPKIDCKDLFLAPVEHPVIDEIRVKDAIEQLRSSFTVWEKVNNRSVQLLDYVTLDVYGAESSPFSPLFSNRRVQVADQIIPKWLIDLLLGKNEGDWIEENDLDLSFFSIEESVKQKKVSFYIKQIERAVIPELNDRFFQKLAVSSIDELETVVRKVLIRHADASVKEKLRENLATLLLDKYRLDIPSSLIDREIHFRMKHLLEDSEYLKSWNKMNDDGKKKVVLSIAEYSEKALRLFYLCRYIVQNSKLEFPKDEPLNDSSSPLESLLDKMAGFVEAEKEESLKEVALAQTILDRALFCVVNNAN